jgi:hypothetical protein
MERDVLFPVNISVDILYSQPSCINYVHLMLISKFVPAKILIRRWKKMIIALRGICLIQSESLWVIFLPVNTRCRFFFWTSCILIGNTRTSINTSFSSQTLVRDSSVGITTRYRQDGRGIESRWGRDFPHPSQSSLGPTQPHIQGVPGVSWG